MGTLSSELADFAQQIADAPRVYVDANLPAGLVRFMRERLKWDVFFVMEEHGLRRAADIEHFRLAIQLRRTLLTQIDAALFHTGSHMPLAGRKLHVHTDWAGQLDHP